LVLVEVGHIYQLISLGHIGTHTSVFFNYVERLLEWSVHALAPNFSICYLLLFDFSCDLLDFFLESFNLSCL